MLNEQFRGCLCANNKRSDGWGNKGSGNGICLDGHKQLHFERVENSIRNEAEGKQWKRELYNSGRGGERRGREKYSS